jgi:hypothetical protein
MCGGCRSRRKWWFGHDGGVFLYDLTCAKQEKIQIAAKMKKTTRFKIRHKVEDRPHF